MRTALILLFLLAVAAIPGSLLPQKSVSIEEVQQFVLDHPTVGPWLDRVWGYEVFSSPWFAAIYLLLFVSLVGCILPRAGEHWRAVRARPPAAPRRLDRLPEHAPARPVDGAPATVAAAVAAALRSGRWRAVARQDETGEWTVSAEKGHLKETGNLLFHTALIAVLLGVAVGSWYGWHGNRLLVAGPDAGFCNTVQQYDEYSLGPRVTGAELPKFCLELTDFLAEYHDSGQPSKFRATVAVDGDGSPRRTRTFSVNDPLRLGDANVYLFGNGYAPTLRYTDRYGRQQTSATTAFLRVDDALTSEGAIKFPDANLNPATGERDPKSQVAFEGLYLPTVPASPPFVRSAHPAERLPGIMLWAYRGDLGEDAGIPGPVYQLDKSRVESGQLKLVGAEPRLLRAGESWTLDDGSKVEFLGTRQWITVSVRHDAGQELVLVGVGVIVVGLMFSLFGRRRRVFFRLAEGAAGASAVTAGGLPRTDYAGFAEEFARVVAAVAPARADTVPDQRERDGRDGVVAGSADAGGTGT
ncbi:cytochrome c biogenesis protein ResB [Pilimelia columellifera]